MRGLSQESYSKNNNGNHKDCRYREYELEPGSSLLTGLKPCSMLTSYAMIV
jgi:hypothetical protein